MFRRNSPSEPPQRYYVESYAPAGGAFKNPKNHAAGLQECLNAGTQQGWKLIGVESGNAVGVKLIIWDTRPD